MNPLYKIYKNLSDNEGLRVLIESHTYETPAIEAAQEEFLTRLLSEKDLERVKIELIQKSNKMNRFLKQAIL
jgi:hypothetical protein